MNSEYNELTEAESFQQFMILPKKEGTYDHHIKMKKKQIEKFRKAI